MSMVNTIGSHTVGEKDKCGCRKINVDTDVGVDVNVDTDI